MDPTREAMTRTATRQQTPEPESARALVAWPRVRAWELSSILVLVAIFVIMGGVLIARDAPLGHDESVYAQRSRHFAGEEVGTGYWQDYRAPGLPALMRVAYEIDPSDASQRAVPLALAAVVVVLTWAFARHLLGPPTGVGAAAMLAFTPGFLRYAWLISLDIPATAFGLGAMMVFALASARERLAPWALLAIPLAGFATATRYGAPAVVGVGLGVLAVARWRRLLRTPVLSLAVLGGSLAAMVAVLMVPAITGSTVAPFRAFRVFITAKGNVFGQSFKDFAEIGPGLLGWVIGPLIIVGILLALYATVRRVIAPAATLTPLAIGIGAIVALGLALNQGVGNYLAPTLPFLCIAGAAGLFWARARLVRIIVTPILGGALAAAAVVAWRQGAADSAWLHDTFDGVRAAAVQADRAVDEECAILTSYIPQVGWYSRCIALGFPSELFAKDADPARFSAEADELIAKARAQLGDGGRLLLYLADRGKRQPGPDALAFIREDVTSTLLTYGTPGQRKGLRFIVIEELDADEA